METSAIHQMSAEHRHIETVIQALADAAAALDKQQRLSAEKLRTVVEFLRVYADARHHQREEAMFFPRLVELGVPPQGCPIGGLNNDHQKGRNFVAALEQQIGVYEQRPEEAAPVLQQTLQEIIKLYRHHLWMEDAMVFPMAEKLISADDNQQLLNKFADLDRTLGSDVVTRLEQFADRLGSQAESLIAS